MNSTQQKQVAMHKDFFDRCRFAIDNGFYMEAILMEYAALESRLEAILGVMGLPCGKNAENRQSIQISHRLSCLRQLFQSLSAFEDSKIDAKFCKELENWVKKRNEYIHGLYKNELKYIQRIANAEAFSEKGLSYCRLLYNETKRLRRYCQKHPDARSAAGCRTSRCQNFTQS